jgi:FMN phosphatase YigB (HAD superfamily)
MQLPDEDCMLAIAFALRGTLTQADQLEYESFIELVRDRSKVLRLPFAASETAAAAQELFSRNAANRVAAGQIAEAVFRLLGDTILEPVLIAQFRQIAARLAQQYVTSTPVVRQTLERIESLGIPTAVLCNGWSRIAQREAECAGFSGRVLVSEDIHAEVPERRAFEKLVEALCVPAERVWFVGNDPYRDIDGAVKAGLKAVWFNPNDQPYPVDCEPPELVVESFDELLPPLCEEYTRSLLSLRNLMRTALEWRDGHFLPPTETW